MSLDAPQPFLRVPASEGAGGQKKGVRACLIFGLGLVE
jgi:hypothetical protein